MFETRRILSLVKLFSIRFVRLCLPPALATQAETIDDLVIALYVYALEVIEKTSALRDHLEQAAPRMIIFLMRLEMLGQLADSLTK
jgi:hypothetical protein